MQQYNIAFSSFPKNMKKLFCTAALMLVMSPFAQAQANFGPGAGAPDLDRQASSLVKGRHLLVKCRDGSRHLARVCRRHGGIARR